MCNCAFYQVLSNNSDHCLVGLYRTSVQWISFLVLYGPPSGTNFTWTFNVMSSCVEALDGCRKALKQEWSLSFLSPHLGDVVAKIFKVSKAYYIWFMGPRVSKANRDKAICRQNVTEYFAMFRSAAIPKAVGSNLNLSECPKLSRPCRSDTLPPSDEFHHNVSDHLICDEFSWCFT